MLPVRADWTESVFPSCFRDFVAELFVYALKLLGRSPARRAILWFVLFLNFGCRCDAQPSQDVIRSLESLPYAGIFKNEGAATKGISGVRSYNREQAYRGYNIYTSHRHLPSGAYVMDMDGNLVHAWAAFRHSFWANVEPRSDGRLAVVLCVCFPEEAKKQGIDPECGVNVLVLDANSRILKKYDLPGKTHHDIDWLDNDNFLTLTERERQITFDGKQVILTNHYITEFTYEGDILRELDLYELLREEDTVRKTIQHFAANLSENNKTRRLDLFHLNSIDQIDTDIPGIAKAGMWLTCSRSLGEVYIIDPATNQIVWRWGNGILDHPHHPSIIDGKTMLVFDNRMWSKDKRSRILEVDLRKKDIVWQYGGKDGEEFFSAQSGAAYRLPNGNTLITVSDRGRAFEIDRQGRIVWDWLHSFRDQKGYRMTLFRMIRVPEKFFEGMEFNRGKIP